MALRTTFHSSLIAFTLCAAFGQPSVGQFEVASVKHVESGLPLGDIPRKPDASPGHFSVRNVPLRYCLAWAYGLQNYQIIGPEWIKIEERYDIFANAPGPASDEQMKHMLQTLLLERFQMKVHREKRAMEAYVLVPGKGTAKVKVAAVEGTPSVGRDSNGDTTYHMSSIADLAFMLSRRMDHPVIDLTGLKGIYDYTVNLSGLAEFSNPSTADPNSVSIFTAIQQDLGLKLESRKHQPVDMLVIDSANKIPIAN